MPSPSPDQYHPLAGQLVVFTGKLSSLARRQARDLVVRLGGATSDEVNSRTTMLVIGAEDDLMIPFHHSREIAAVIAGARLECVQGGHFHPVTRPQIFAELLADFLK